MKTIWRMLLVFGFTLSWLPSGYAAEPVKTIQVERVEVSSLGVDTSKPFRFVLSAILVSEVNLGRIIYNSNYPNGFYDVTCNSHEPDFNVQYYKTISLGQNRYKLTCEVTGGPATQSMAPDITPIWLVITSRADDAPTAIVPKSNFLFSSEQTDEFGTKSIINFPLSATLGVWDNSFVNWGNDSITGMLGWTFGLAVNPPASYVFPKYPIQDRSFVVFSTNETLVKTTYTIDTKKRTLNVKCPNPTPAFSLGGAKSKVITKLKVGNNIVAGPSWNFNLPGVRGKALDVSCITQTVLTNHLNQIIGYRETIPVKVKFPK